MKEIDQQGSRAGDHPLFDGIREFVANEFVPRQQFFEELGEKARAGEILDHELDRLKHELDAMGERGGLPPHLAKLREDLDAVTPAGTKEGGNG